MRMRLTWVGFVVFFGACGGGSPAKPTGSSGVLDPNGPGSADDCSPEIGSLASGLFAEQCATSGCHVGAMAAAALDLTGLDLATRLIGQAAGTCDGWKLVVPGDAESSLLVRKLEGKVPSDCGDVMPPAGDLVSDKELACVRGWINTLGPDSGSSTPGCETCGGAGCVDFSIDAAHCGGCDTTCPSGASCTGRCECPADLTLCSDRCADTTRDAAHCGGCGKPCGAFELCSGSACSCGPGFDECPSGCTELASDPLNCGGCGIQCGAGKLCTPSGCATQMACAGLAKCGSACVDTSKSLLHCGGCNMPCAAGEACVNGACACPGGGLLCNGACINASTDPTNCGACGNVCPDGTACEQGACQCPGGGAACGADCVDLQVDRLHCGGCNIVCAPGQACEGGQCTCADRAVSFTQDVAPVLERNCTNAGCHTGTRAKAGLDLTLSNSYAELVGVRATQCSDGRLLVAPGQPATSYLMQKMLGVQMCSGTQMPKAGVTLPRADLEAVTAWICQGAAK